MSVRAAKSVRRVAIRAKGPRVPPGLRSDEGRRRLKRGPEAQRKHRRMQHMTERETPSVDGLVIGILGGTGDQGRGLARRFALAGHPVIIGSRSHERAHAAAQEIGHDVRGLANRDAAVEASVVIAAVPWEGHGDLLSGLATELAGKIVVDCVNPLGFDQRGAYALPVAEGGPVEGSAAEQAAALLPGSRVVAAFHHVSAVLLLDPEVDTIDLDVLVLGDDRQATDLVQAL